MNIKHQCSEEFYKRVIYTWSWTWVNLRVELSAGILKCNYIYIEVTDSYISRYNIGIFIQMTYQCVFPQILKTLCDVASVLFVIFHDIVGCSYILLWPQEAELALLHPHGCSPVRSFSRFWRSPSHVLLFSSLSPLCSVSHKAQRPHCVTAIHSPAGLIVALQISFIGYSSSLEHFTAIPLHLSQCWWKFVSSRCDWVGGSSSLSSLISFKENSSLEQTKHHRQ